MPRVPLRPLSLGEQLNIKRAKVSTTPYRVKSHRVRKPLRPKRTKIIDKNLIREDIANRNHISSIKYEL